jgi:hypothetical protein
LYLIYALLWPDDGCFTAETCRLGAIDILLQCCLLIVVFLDGNIPLYGITQRGGLWQKMNKFQFLLHREQSVAIININQTAL